MKYITVKHPKNDTGKTTLFVRMLTYVLPRSNKDIEELIDSVHESWLEIGVNDLPTREIAFDAHGSVLFTAPDERNYGVYTDSGVVFPDEPNKPEVERDFQKVWNAHVK